VALNHFFSPSCIKKECCSAQVINPSRSIASLNLQLRSFQLSSWNSELRVKGPYNIFLVSASGRSAISH